MATESSDCNTPIQDEPSTSSSSTATPGPSSSTASINMKDKEEALQLALNNLVQGKRHLLVKDIASAIISLGDSCQILTETNGALCADNAEAHFYYGKALLEQSRLDLAVFESGPSTENKTSSEEEKDDDDESAEEENEGSDEEEDGESAKKESDENEAEAEVQKDTTAEVSGEKSVIEKVDEKKEEDLNAPSPMTVVDAEKPSTSSGITATNGEKEGEEELSNLELAWEVLEVAKICYSLQLDLVNGKLAETKTEDEEKKKLLKSQTHLQKRLAETHSLLGEVATESENYPQAVEDFKTGIAVLSQIESPDSREIAQYYFQIGLAYAFGKSFKEGIESFKKSKEIIEQRIANLAFKIENKQTAKDLGVELEDPNCAEDVEIEELRALLPELDEKVNDTIDAERENKASLEEETKEREILVKNSPVKNPTQPAANDISHLVKKKQKAEGSPTETPPVKRLCIDVNDVAESKKNEVSSSSSSNGHSNGSTGVNP